jgi:hypothetical protein
LAKCGNRNSRQRKRALQYTTKMSGVTNHGMIPLLIPLWLARWGRLGYLSPLAWNGAKAMLSGFPLLYPAVPPWMVARSRCLAIVRLLCQLPKVIIADAQSKRLCWPYKRTITYHVRAWAWVGTTSANQLSVRTGGRDAQDSQPIGANPLANHRPHHTRLPPDLLLARALRLGKYPVSKIFCAKVTRQVIIY